MKKLLLKITAGLGVAFLAIQLVPYGREHTNPPVGKEPRWDSPRTRDLTKRACFDCHSHETRWPWYTNVAPVSWLTQHDVDEGREKLNFSDWARPQEEAEEAAETVEEGEMPPWFYLPTHPEARLNAQEKVELIKGLKATLGEEAAEGKAPEKGKKKLHERDDD